MSKRLIVQSSLLTKMALVEVPDKATEADVRRAALEAIPEAQRTDDLEVTFERADDAGDADDDTADDVGKANDGKGGNGEGRSIEIADGMRVHVSRCKKVAVTIRYFGKTKAREFAPAVRIKVVKDWATKAFELPPAEAARHSLRLPDAKEELGGDVQVGTLVVEGTCGVTLDLIPSDRINGAR